MFFVTRVVVGDRERVLVSRKGRFEAILSAGTHVLFGFGIELERFDVSDLCLDSPWEAFLALERPELVASLFHVVETGPKHVAAVWRDGKLERIQGPGERTLVWKTAAPFAVDLIDATEHPVAPRELMPALRRLNRASGFVLTLIDDGKCGLLFLDGRFVETLAPGAYALWTGVSTPTVEVFDLRVQTVEISGQEIMTADKVSIRANVWAEYKIIDPVKARQTVKNPAEHLYKAVQLAVRQTLAKRTLDEVLLSRTDIDSDVEAQVKAQAFDYGVSVGAIAVKDLIPPGDVRDLLNEVVAAEKRAQANLILRREETAATRSLLNTAKLMAENPLLVRMKELEALEKVAAKVDKISILGGPNELLDNFITIGRK